MKDLIKLLTAVFALVISTMNIAKAQTLHTIVFCNTIDESIGKSMSLEFLNVKNKVRTLAELVEYDEDHYALDGKNCTRENLKSIIDEMEVDADDVILTFYGGHGSHAKNDSDPWPQYCMNTGFENQGNWVPMAELQKWVQAKGARLSIIISNCCNVIQESTTKKPLWAMGGNYTKLDALDADKFKRLLATKGLVMATSSRVPEPSWCCVPDGGLYTCDFIQAMKEVGNGIVSADWNSVLKRAYDLCATRDIVDKDGAHHKQHPFYKVYSGGSVTPPHSKDDRSNTNPLEQSLIDIVDKSKDQSVRLKMIPNIVSRNFVGITKVLTVGTDMETIVDYENPTDFLRRICLSPYIKRVNVVNNQDGYLTVHEIR